MCGVFGMFTYGKPLESNALNGTLHSLAIASADRGTDATGIAFLNNDKIVVQKAPVPADRFRMSIPKGVSAVMGHTRHATQGAQQNNINNHPWISRTRDGTAFSLAHNGILWNDKELREIYNLPKTPVATDSYIAVQLLQQEVDTSIDSIISAIGNVEGSYVFTVLDDTGRLTIVRGDNPVVMLHVPNIKTYIYASTEMILFKGIIDSPLLQYIKNNRKIEEIPIDNCEIIQINRYGKIEQKLFHKSRFGLFSDYTAFMEEDFPPMEYYENLMIDYDI